MDGGGADAVAGGAVAGEELGAEPYSNTISDNAEVKAGARRETNHR